MSVEMAVWRLRGNTSEMLETATFDSEERLETLLISDPAMLGTDLLVVGRQVQTSFGGRIDLLALDDDGNVHVLELKRDQTPRDTVAQLLDYGSWAAGLGLKELQDIFAVHQGGSRGSQGEAAKVEPLDSAFAQHFGKALPEVVNVNQRFTIVASKLDNASERIVEYLAESYDVPINAIFFRYFADEGREYFARTWLIDPHDVETRSTRKPGNKSRTWNGRDYYAVLGNSDDHEGIRWRLARPYGFLNGGGGKRYWLPLRHLEPGHRVFAHVAGCGYVGVGEVTGKMRPLAEATITVDGEERRLVDQPDIPTYFVDAARSDDEDSIEMVVPVEWTVTRDISGAYWEPGLFANQNTACKLTDQNTIDKVSAEFGLEEKHAALAGRVLDTRDASSLALAVGEGEAAAR